MGFMIPTAEYFAVYHVETNAGTEIVPEYVCGSLEIGDCPECKGRGFVALDGSTLGPEVGSDPTKESPCPACDSSCKNENDWPALEDYLEGKNIEDVERKEGWYARLSANGYLDCTGWDGPYETSEAALDAVKELYDVNDDGDDASESEVVSP